MLVRADPNPTSTCALYAALLIAAYNYINLVHMSLPSQSGQKRKGLWDHSTRPSAVRNFTRIRGSNSLLISSSTVTTNSAPAPVYLPHPSTSANDESLQTGDNDEGPPQLDAHVPSNPNSSESLGIKVKPKRRYQNTVCLPPYSPVSCADCYLCSLSGRSSKELGG